MVLQHAVDMWESFIRGAANLMLTCILTTVHIRLHLKPQLQIKAGAEKSTDTREIMNRYCKLGITRSILHCADAVAMLVMYGYRTLTNQNIETSGRYYSTVWYPPTLTNRATGILRYH